MRVTYPFRVPFACVAFFALLQLTSSQLESGDVSIEPILSRDRVVFQTIHGDIEFGFFPDVAPITANHIFKLVKLGCYSGITFFRVDKGFVAQTADCAGRQTPPLNDEQRAEAIKTVPLEVVKGVKHTEGVLSLGRYDDPNSGTSSFSILLGAAPHLDMQYTIFGRVTNGMETLRRMENLPVRQEGIFVMPVEPPVILSSYWKFDASGEAQNSAAAATDDEDKLTLPGSTPFRSLTKCALSFQRQAKLLQRTREKCLPH